MDNFSRVNYTEKDLESIMKRARLNTNGKSAMSHTRRRANRKRAYFGGERNWEDVAFDGDPIYGSSGVGPDGFYYSFYVHADDFNLVFEAQNEDTMDPEESWTFEHGGDIPSGEYLVALGDAMATDFVRTGGVSNPIGKVFRRANRKTASNDLFDRLFSSPGVFSVGSSGDIMAYVDLPSDEIPSGGTNFYWAVIDSNGDEIVGGASSSFGEAKSLAENNLFRLSRELYPESYTSHRANRKRASLVSLDEALQQVANASFYEDKQITPETDGNGNIAGYRVEDDYGMNTDDWQWTYDQGLMDADSVSETSRLMDHYEHFANAEHIRYNMSESVKALESGQTVTFAYAIVSDADAIFDEETQEYYDADGDPTDDVAGWILTADWF